MAIDVRRVGHKWPKRYLADVTRPHGEWRTDTPASKSAIRRKLYALGNHSTDIGDAFAAADEAWRAARSSG
jgi:hypothetical protein